MKSIHKPLDETSRHWAPAGRVIGVFGPVIGAGHRQCPEGSGAPLRCKAVSGVSPKHTGECNAVLRAAEPRWSGLRVTLILLLAIPLAFAGKVKNDGIESKRPESWAQPVELEGVPNLHKVSDTLYRSAQPTEEGMKNLKEMGIETIINLRSFHSDRDEIGDTGLAYEHIYMKAWHIEYKEALRFLQIVTNPRRTPVLVHCMHGSDRTGTVCAIYRVAVQDWSKEDAIREMTKGGFGFHKVWDNLPEWIEELDIEALRKKVGIEVDEL